MRNTTFDRCAPDGLGPNWGEGSLPGGDLPCDVVASVWHGKGSGWIADSLMPSRAPWPRLAPGAPSRAFSAPCHWSASSCRQSPASRQAPRDTTPASDARTTIATPPFASASARPRAEEAPQEASETQEAPADQSIAIVATLATLATSRWRLQAGVCRPDVCWTVRPDPQ